MTFTKKIILVKCRLQNGGPFRASVNGSVRIFVYSFMEIYPS